MLLLDSRCYCGVGQVAGIIEVDDKAAFTVAERFECVLAEACYYHALVALCCDVSVLYEQINALEIPSSRGGIRSAGE